MTQATATAPLGEPLHAAELASARRGKEPFPRVPGLPLVGNLRELRGERIGLLESAHRRFGDACMLSVAGLSLTFVQSPDLAHDVLVEHADAYVKSRGLRIFAKPLLGDGILTTSSVPHHRRHRKLMAPAFAHRRFAAYADVMTTRTEAAAAELRPLEPGRTIDVAALMMRVTLGIVAETLFGTNVDAEAKDLGEALTVANRWLIEEVTSLVHFPLSWPTPRNVRARRAIARLDETIYRIIRERRASGEDRGDVLSMLLAARDEDGSALDDHEVRDEAMTLFLAGHETTANALAWCFDLLERHPEVRAKLREEAHRVLAGRTPTFADLPALPYALAVFKETLRLRPPAYFVGRESLRDVTLGGRVMPKGSLVFVNIYGIHRRADLFPEPEAFRPERFEGDAEKQLPRFAYLPFGGGPRVCIGNHFALMEGQLMLATLAQRVTFERAPGERPPEPEPLVTLRPRGGLPMIARLAPG